jgi:predicted nucleic acid-binding protein
MIVVDASVLVDALADDGPAGDAASTALSAETEWAAPEHMMTEVLSAVRGRVLAGKTSEARGAQVVSSLHRLAIDSVPVHTVAERVWALRHNLTAYDAAYVAVAELLGCAVLTRDSALADVPGARCPVIVVGA